jgi:V/A-type H+-transporting ATPase subunit D
MAKVALNKSSLKQQRDLLGLYKRYLPSLDLKRRQLLTEFKAAQQKLAEADSAIDELNASLEGLMELLGASTLDLAGLVSIDSVQVDEQNVLGVKLPVAREVKFKVADYSTLAKPFWVDFLVEKLQAMATLRVRQRVEAERVKRLDQAVRRTTQRVNLFDKVLIPTAQDNIKRIQVAMADAERAAVVRSKISKQKREQAAAT